MATKRALQTFVKQRGYKKVARSLGTSESSLRRALSRPGRLSGLVAERWSEATYGEEERHAIQSEPQQVVPGYGPQKMARVLSDIRHLRGQNSIAHQEAKQERKALLKHRAQVPDYLQADIDRFVRLDISMAAFEQAVSPSETIEERLSRVDDIDREYLSIARKFNLTHRAVYSLYYSPPTTGAA